MAPLATESDVPWRTEGLFSTHYLLHRLTAGAAWPQPAGADAAFDEARKLYRENADALAKKGNEEDCETRFITPLLLALGFGLGNRKAIPKAQSLLLPDYLLYERPSDADRAFQTGDYYPQCIGLLEAKRWGRNLSEDASGKGKAARGRSPHYQIRDYLTESSELTWGILTNGKEWRLYCKKDRASAFFEFHLGEVLALPDEDEARRWFHFFYALFSRAAFRKRPDGSCALDVVREQAQQFKEEIERNLRGQVFDSVELLARGFLDNSANDLGADDLPTIYENSLIFLYRVLFILNAEARELLPTRPANDAARKYVASYGLQMVRQKLASPETASEYADDATFQLWERLAGLFTLINGKPASDGRRDKNEELGIPRYNGGLFDPNRHPFLEKCRVPDKWLGDVLKYLSFRIGPDGSLTSFDYANLGERHLGSVYEGLLEHHLALVGGVPRLMNDKGERKTSGAYYTPESLVAYIVENTLTPILGPDAVPLDPDAPPDDSFAHATLALNVCDPAMGSGHFLVEAVSFLAERIAAHPTTAPRPVLKNDGTPRRKTDGSGEPLCTQEAKLAYWKRRVVEACIYGVDLNPLAVELAKLSLWLKTVDRVPLNFLDHHLRYGNSLLGTDLKSLPGLPEPKKKAGPKKNAGQLSMEFHAAITEALRQVIARIHEIESVSTDTHDAAKTKERLWREVAQDLLPRFRALGDVWMARWFGGEVSLLDYLGAVDDPVKTGILREQLKAVLDPLRCFHWELEFPDIFFDEHGNPRADGGFDAVIGNPPWERMKLQQNEFFAGRCPEIALAPTASARKTLIAALHKTDPALWKEYEAASGRAEDAMRFMHRSGFYPLMGRGDTNLYAVFAEKMLNLTRPSGRLGMLVPSGIATDSTTKEYFQKLVTERRLAELLDFENQGIFPDVDSRFKFSILLASGPASPQPAARCGFFLHSVDEIADPGRTFPLTPEDFRLFNPNTLTCPIFRRQRDTELTRRIYENVPILLDLAAGEGANRWGASFLRMFDMALDSKKFQSAPWLEAAGYWMAPGNIYVKGPHRYLPLYEGKMFQAFDHRASNIDVVEANVHRPGQGSQVSQAEHGNRNFSPTFRFWVDEAEATVRLPSGAKTLWQVAFKKVCSPTNVRTVIATALPPVAAGDSVQFLVPARGIAGSVVAGLLANLNAFALDFVARQKVGNVNLNYFIVEQLPILPPYQYDHDWHGVLLKDFVSERVLKLSYTAYDLKGLADDLGYTGDPFPWDEEERLHLRCQLDAIYFHLYGLTRDEASEILDTFPIVKRQDEQRYDGRFRTKDLILGYYNAYGAGNMDARVKA